MLTTKNHILLQTELVHSYPYDWRSNTPVILRGSKQWFIDTNCLQEMGLRALQSVKISPEASKNGFQGVLENRPYWCISRQRVWGVPIPVFYGDDDLPVINSTIIGKICESIEKHGTDSW
jgi:isoleucyl-tRNA synthetase